MFNHLLFRGRFNAFIDISQQRAELDRLDRLKTVVDSVFNKKVNWRVKDLTVHPVVNGGEIPLDV